MPENQMSEIQTMPKFERKGILNSDSSDVQAFGTTPNYLKSELTTPTIIQHSNAIINAFLANSI